MLGPCQVKLFVFSAVQHKELCSDLPVVIFHCKAVEQYAQCVWGAKMA